jgi:hypothetical protein
MNKKRSFHLLWTLASCLALSAGLGCGDAEGRLQVTGSVKHPDGTVPKGPASGYVYFNLEPDPATPQARSATGVIDKETGEFELYTEKPGDGAFPGKYKVTLRINSVYPPRQDGSSSVVPLEYTQVETTPLSAEIDAGHRRFDFTVPKRGSSKKK